MIYKVKPAKLSRESDRLWNTAIAAQKRGTKERRLKRVEEWARWKLEQQGVAFPVPTINSWGQKTGPKIDFTFDGTHGIFTCSEWLPGRSEPVFGPRGGKKGWRYIDGGLKTTEIGRVVIPEGCHPVADADLWHAMRDSQMRFTAVAA